MKFHTLFTRVKPAAPPAKTLDAADPDPRTTPTPPSADRDNVLVSHFFNINGWPCHRVAVLYKYTGVGPAIDLPAEMYMWEENLQQWFLIGSKNIKQGEVGFFDCVALLDRPKGGGGEVAEGRGSLEQLLRVKDPGAAPNGTYEFAIGADLTTTP